MSSSAWGAAAGAIGAGLLQYGQRKEELAYQRDRDENLLRIQRETLQEAKDARVEGNEIKRTEVENTGTYQRGMAEAANRQAGAAETQAQAARDQVVAQREYWAGQLEALDDEHRRELIDRGILRFDEKGAPVFSEELLRNIKEVNLSKSPYAGYSAILGADARNYDTRIQSLTTELEQLKKEASDMRYVGDPQAKAANAVRIEAVQAELDRLRASAPGAPPLLGRPAPGAAPTAPPGGDTLFDRFQKQRRRM